MNTFESIREFIVPADLCDLTDAKLREAGLDGNERFVLLSGIVQDDCLVVQTLHCPRQTAFKSGRGLCVRVEAAELHRLNVWLYDNSERLAIQVHSHPTAAFHSEIDDTYPMVTTLGGLSLVVPDFARYGVRGPDTALFRLSAVGWQEILPADAQSVLKLES
jgi:hypothetical protein